MDLPHHLLFSSLLKGDLHGRAVNLLRDMCIKLGSCVEIDGYPSEELNCSIDTRQVCMLNPILFVFFLNNLIHLTIVSVYCK